MKTKRTILSMVVFVAVFWLSFILANTNKTLRVDSSNTLDSNITANEAAEPYLQDSSSVNEASNYYVSLNQSKAANPLLTSFNSKQNSDEFVSTSDIAINDNAVYSEQELLSCDTNTTDEAATLGATIAGFGISQTDLAVLSDINPEEFLTDTPKYANLGISIANSYVNIRLEPDTNSKVLGKLYNGSVCEIIEQTDDWYYVESGSVTGYVSNKYIKTDLSDEDIIKNFGVLRISVNVNGLNVREQPDVNSKKLTTIYLDEKYHVIDLQDEWIKIDVSDDKVIGYIKREYAELIVNFKKAISTEEEKELLNIQKEAQIKEEQARKEAQAKNEAKSSKSSQPKDEAKVTYRNEVDCTKDDLKLLVCLVHAEAGNQSYEGKLAVANVVLNRVKSRNYPNTIKDVIYQSGQFSVSTSGSLDKQLKKYEDYSSESQKLTIKAVKSALAGTNNIGSRLHFNAYKSAVKKGYDDNKGSIKIDDQLFW